MQILSSLFRVILSIMVTVQFSRLIDMSTNRTAFSDRALAPNIFSGEFCKLRTCFEYRVDIGNPTAFTDSFLVGQREKISKISRPTKVANVETLWFHSVLDYRIEL